MRVSRLAPGQHRPASAPVSFLAVDVAAFVISIVAFVLAVVCFGWLIANMVAARRAAAEKEEDTSWEISEE